MSLLKRIWIAVIPAFFFLSSEASEDTLVAYRITHMQTDIPLQYDKDVKAAVRELLSDKEAMAVTLARYERHRSYIDSVFAYYQLPVTLRLFPVGMSGMDPAWEGENGEAGVWAMNYSTAYKFSLKMNAYVDERRLVERSTDVAALYFSELRKLYHDWYLCLAAYASSTTEVNKAIRAAKGNMDYQAIKPYLSKEARQIVPAFTAGVYLHAYHKEHKIQKAQLPALPETVEWPATRWMSFSLIGQTLDMKANLLRELNPLFKKDIIPLAATPYGIMIPASARDSLFKLDLLEYHPYGISEVMQEVPELENNNIPVKKSEQDTLNNPGKKEAVPGKKVVHVVKKGESLGLIASRYKCTVAKLKTWNNLKGNTIYPGQKLVIYR